MTTTRHPRSFEDLPASTPRFIGKRVDRVEDPQLVTGRTPFIDNLTEPGLLHCAFLRSPYAHARIKSIDTSEAEKLPGVVAIVTGEDAKAMTNPIPSVPEGWGGYCLATDKVRFVGEPVAAVAADNRYVAEDAVERINVEYEPLETVVDAHRALDEDAPLLFEEHGSNLILAKDFRWGEVERAFAEADHVFTERLRWHRLGANPMETFGVISKWDPIEESLTCWAAVQSQSHAAMGVATVLGIPSHKMRMIAQPHGGSFGGKGGFRGSFVTAMLSRKSGGRPVKWTEDRMEYLVAGGSQSWDRHYQVSLAVKDDGTITALKVELLDDLGATAEGFGAVSVAKPLASFVGCYAIEAAEYDFKIVATNKLFSSPYRGMGPPPHNCVLEMAVDVAARGLGMDPAEIRRKNFIAADAFPYTIPSGNEYDSGDYHAMLDKAIEISNYAELRRRQEEARKEGRYLGIGVVTTIEPGVFDWNAYAVVGMPLTGVPEGATVSFDMLGKITARIGFAHEGQGQLTLISQLLADYFGVEMSDVRVVQQDSLSAPPHFGPGGSRLGVAITGAVLGAAERLRAKLARVAAHLMQCPPEALEFKDGMFRIPGVEGAEMHVAQVAATMRARSDLLPEDVDPSPEATCVWTAPGRTPADDQGRAKSYLTAASACHVVLVEVDVETGKVKILGYWIADDCGTRLNPTTVEGMTQGGVAQGVGAALLEEAVYDEDGQLVTSTFMDYLLPTVHEVPVTEKAALVTPSPFTPLGAKGVGEGAIHTTPAAILCAINDALAPLGAHVTEVPATPIRIWQAIREARGKATAG